MNARRAKRKARLARKRWRLANPPSLRTLSDILKRAYPQAAVYSIAYKGKRLLGGKFKCRYNPANRVRRYAPHPLAAYFGFGDV